MDDEGGVGILPTEDEQAKKQEVVEAEKESTQGAKAPGEGEGEEAGTSSMDAEASEAASTDEAGQTSFAGENHILALKTQVGQERRVLEMLGNKSRRFGIPIQALLAPQELRGYVFIETTDILAVEKGIRGVSYARSLVSREEEVRDANGEFLRDRRGKIVTRRMPVDTPFSEIAHFLTPVSAVAKIMEGDIVELVSGPFRGEKAKVTRVDDAREELTVELIDSMVPIPITVKGEHVRVLEKAG